MTSPSKTLHAWWLGRQDYKKVWTAQRTIQRRLIEGNANECVVLCEHHPVITIGTSGSEDALLSTSETLAKQGIEVHKVERGGEVTYHGPGQLVAYPLMDLREKQRDVGWYMRNLETAAIRTLAYYNVLSEQIQGRTGIWVTEVDTDQPNRKIGFVGVRLSRWCTMHGLALNIFDCQPGFSHIIPCGLPDIGVTSIAQCTGHPPSLASVARELTGQLAAVFDFKSYTFSAVEPQQADDSFFLRYAEI